MPPIAGTPVDDVDTIAGKEARILRDIASGEYDGWIKIAMFVLRLFGLGRVAIFFQIFLTVNRITAPKAPLVADGRGGVVPSDNSRYNPKTGVFTEGPFSGPFFDRLFS